MMVGRKYTAGFNLFEKLIVDNDGKQKTCVVMFPSNCPNARYNNKKFILECITSSVDEDKKKSNDSNYSGEAVKITLLNYDIENTQDTKGTINCPLSGFKSNNAKLRYGNTTFVVIEEKENEFRNSVTLYCDITV